MKMKKRMLLAISLIFFVQLFARGGVLAKEEEYPAKEIQVLVGYVPGTTHDLSARALAKVAPKYLKKPLVVVNMPGASSSIACNELVNSAADGYMIMVAGVGHRSVGIHQQRLTYDPKMMKTVLGYADYRQVLFVRGDSPYAKFEDFIAYGQKNPGAIKWGCAGRGNANHLQTLLLFRDANIKAIDVPYKGTPEFIQAVLGGHIMAAVVDISGVKSHVKAGTLKLVCTFAAERLPDFPEVPTSKEKGYVTSSLFSTMVNICIHRDTPADRVKKLHDALKKAVEDPEFRKPLEDMGQKVGYIPPETVDATILSMEKLGVPILKELKLFVQ